MAEGTQNDPWKPITADFFTRPADQVAKDLLGRYLSLDAPDLHAPGLAPPKGRRLTLRLVEVEAYLGRIDRASHAWNGRRTARNESLYLSPGHAYVYLIYGIHHCLNVVTAGDAGGAVLLRAGEAIEGAEEMLARRSRPLPAKPGDIAGGPGKLCQALGVDRAYDGVRFGEGRLHLFHGTPVVPGEVASGPRIGIDYAEEAVDWPLRFAISGHREMSRPRLSGSRDPSRPQSGVT